ncbi:MAG TPA: hypothetical protein VMF63_01655, partial [Opitutaceae bacterium]|nr:hypothetical protein [Opitutaceae bacterium]
EAAIGFKTGPVQLELSLRQLPLARRVPVIATGAGTDYLYAERVDARHLRFGFVHLGDPDLRGAAVPFDPEVSHVLTADLGSLYPPDQHPALADWEQPLRDALHRRVHVTLDGICVLHGASDFYPSDPLHIYIGRSPIAGLTTPRFPGTIYRVMHLDLPAPSVIRREGWTGPVRLHLRFPPFTYVISEPLLSTGSRAAGDMVYVTYLGPGRVRFGHDSMNGGGVETRVVSLDPDREHTLDIDFAPLRTPPGKEPAMTRALKLKFDGRWLICINRPSHPTLPYQVVFGFNANEMGTAKDAFSGSTLRPETIAPLPPPELATAGIGPIEIAFRFPPFLPGVHEPLLVTGHAGAGDFVYIIYESGRHFRLGVDHWGVGGRISEPIIDDGQVHTVTITSAALFPPLNDPAWKTVPREMLDRLRDSIRVDLDGQTVIDAPYRAYPCAQPEIVVGNNHIGGSTTGPRFTGEILSVARLGFPTAEPEANRYFESPSDSGQ